MTASNGSRYVAVVFVVLAAYAGYEWWFNPVRMIQRRLGQIAAVLSTPEHEPDLARATRIARLRPMLADDVRVRVAPDGPEIATRDAVLAALGTLRPERGGLDVQFVDLKVTLDAEDAARAHMTVEVTGRDARTGEPTLDARTADVRVVRHDGDWVVTTAEWREIPIRP